MNKDSQIEEKIANIVFKYGVGMVADQTALSMGALNAEMAEQTQGKKTADAIKELTTLLNTEIEKVQFTSEEIMWLEHASRAWSAQITKETHNDWFDLQRSVLAKVKSLSPKKQDLDKKETE